MGSSGSTDALIGAGAGIGLAAATGGASLLVGGLAGGAIGGLFGGSVDASAKAQQEMGMAQLGQEQSNRFQASQFANATPEEIQQMQQAISLNSQDISRRQRILDSADPALIEAGKQALSLMQGKDAASLDPLRHQRDIQRQQLVSQLQSQLGPDYATSSQGQAALNNFDRQTADSLAGAQQAAIGQYLPYAQGAQTIDSLQPGIANSASMGQLFGDIQKRKIAAITGTPVNPGLAFSGDAAKAAGQQAFMGQIVGAGATIGMSRALGGGGGGGGVGNGVGTKTAGGDANWAGSYA